MGDQQQESGTRLLRDIVYGMIGGLVGTLVMEQVSTFIYKFESDDKKRREEDLQKEPVPLAMVRRISEDVIGVELTEETCSSLGQAVHWGYGMAWGGLYGALHDRMPAFSKARGAPFGFAFTATADGVYRLLRKTVG
ncbi:MAG: hypothetical protein ACRD1R_05510 [Acidobacteriota bacterium]